MLVRFKKNFYKMTIRTALFDEVVCWVMKNDNDIVSRLNGRWIKWSQVREVLRNYRLQFRFKGHMMVRISYFYMHNTPPYPTWHVIDKGVGYCVDTCRMGF